MLKKITILLLIILIFPILSSAYTPKKEALLVGVEQYMNGDRLNGVKLDIDRMKRLLEKRGFHVIVLFNKKATVKNVVEALKSYQHLNSNDSFIFYNSLHGTQVPDQNGDEKLNGELDDLQDEALVLYEGNNYLEDENGLLIDDQLDILLSKIPARKLMINDACHSGTIYKSFNRNAKIKGVNSSKNFQYKNKEIANLPIVHPTNLVVFSASRDNESSIVVPTGSFFTKAFKDAWETDRDITFKEMKRKTTIHIENSCSRDNRFITYHPTLYVSNSHLKNITINNFLQINYQLKPEKSLVEKFLDRLIISKKVGQLRLNAKDFYNIREHIQFNINTFGKTGHLYILSSKESENEIKVLYPNHHYQNANKQWRGQFSFPDASKPFAFQADNNTNGLERTVVYAILSQSIIPELEVSRVGYNKFQSIFKDFNSQSNLINAFKSILIKNNQIAIGKKVFSVGIQRG